MTNPIKTFCNICGEASCLIYPDQLGAIFDINTELNEVEMFTHPDEYSVLIHRLVAHIDTLNDSINASDDTFCRQSESLDLLGKQHEFLRNNYENKISQMEEVINDYEDKLLRRGL